MLCFFSVTSQQTVKSGAVTGPQTGGAPHSFIIIFLFTANLSRLAVWWVCNVGSVIKFLINYLISLIRL